MGRGVIDEQLYDELEEVLLQADMSINSASEILEELRKAVREEKITETSAMKARLQQAIAQRMTQKDAPGLIVSDDAPTVYIFVGVNGVGKTTTIAKVAALLKRKGLAH